MKTSQPKEKQPEKLSFLEFFYAYMREAEETGNTVHVSDAPMAYSAYITTNNFDFVLPFKYKGKI